MEEVVWFQKIDKNDVKSVGGKGANLGELYRAGIPVPNGFVITADTYLENLKNSGAFDRIRGILFNLDVENPSALEEKARACQREINAIRLKKNLTSLINKYYNELSQTTDALVAVRSSATAEDLPEASFAGQQSTYLNVKGIKNLCQAILACWASLFEPRAIFYRVQKKFDHLKVAIAVPVQKMIQSEISGVMFTLDPVTNNKDIIVIEAIYGLGEPIVAGELTPDHYEVDKESFKIKTKNIASQNKQLVLTRSGNKFIKVSKTYQRKQKMTDDKIIELAKIGQKIEQHYYFPQDIEWASENSKLYIVQTRPVTTLHSSSQIKDVLTQKVKTLGLKLLLHGAPASPAIGTGKVVIISSPKELRRIEKGDVLVTSMTNPDYVPAMRRASAIVTDLGGRTSHAAIVCRELGIACVVGTGNATKKLTQGMVVTVDGAKGVVYRGQIQNTKKDFNTSSTVTDNNHKTATKLYVNLAEPELAPQIAAKNVDGVGLLRAEFILAQIGVHPKKYLADNKGEKFIEVMSSKLAVFARSFGKRPVIYRATDLKSNEYKTLKGGDKYEPHEPNPMLGYRGAFRYIKDPDVFKLELEALKRVRAKYSNLHLMIPFVRTPQELMTVKSLVAESGLFDDHLFKFWMMAEIPANVIMLEDFLKVGLDGVSIGSNDLTMLTLGTDRDNEEVSSQFEELNPAVLWSLERIIKTCLKFKVSCSICGQGPSVYPELTEKLVSWGITSISVNPDVINSTRELIYLAEKKLISRK